MSEAVKKIVKKKVRPYPISGELEANGVKIPVELIHLTEIGALVRPFAKMVFVGSFHQLIFNEPITRETIITPVRVLKTYDKPVDLTAKKIERVAELHFQNLTSAHKSRIVAFLAAIGQ